MLRKIYGQIPDINAANTEKIKIDETDMERQKETINKESAKEQLIFEVSLVRWCIDAELHSQYSSFSGFVVVQIPYPLFQEIL